MGLASASSFRQLDPLKWYRVLVDVYWVVGGPQTGCDDPWISRCQCCRTGAVIQAWIDAGNECVPGALLCFGVGQMSQRIVDIWGPYNDNAACLLEIENPCGL